MKFRFGEERKNQILSFSNILPDVIDDLKLKDSFFVENIKHKWDIYVGKILSVHSFPDRIFKKTLFVNVDHSAYANELSLYSEKIIGKLKDDFGPDYIHNIRFEIIKKGRYRK